jgi:hypothetical protein
MPDDDDFDLRAYFLSILDPEERARTIHESGWGGHPDIEDLERAVATPGGGLYQAILAGFQSGPIPKSSDLSGEQVIKLYHALSFALWQFGSIMTAHVTILWQTLGIHNHKQAATLLWAYLNRSYKRAAVGSTGATRQRRRERTGQGFILRYGYTLECGGAEGLHAHILMNVPPEAVPAFSIWTRQILARLAGHPGDEHTVRVVASKAQTEPDAIARHWGWFRYIAKELSPHVTIGPIGGQFTPLRDLLQLWPYRANLPVFCGQLVGGSRDIWTKAQRDAGFKSQLEYGDPRQIYNGWELDDWRLRRLVAEIKPIL